MEQRILNSNSSYSELDSFFEEKKVKKLFLVCDGALQFLRIKDYFSEIENRLGIKVIKFSDFNPNPLYESVVNGVKRFNEEECDMIAAIGGGSAIDVAKCIKLYSNMNSAINYLEQKIIPNDIPLLAIPTTAGTGSEATKFAVIYYNGEKQSIADESCIPEAVLFDPDFLVSLPEYQKKSTMLDAFCHAVESCWSVNSTEESRKYAKESLKLITENKENYLNCETEACRNMLKAANSAGKAINISQTTAGHAMCYKLTSLYGIAHGHSASLCLSVLLPYMANNSDKCIDPRGEKHFIHALEEISEVFNASCISDGVRAIIEFIDSVGLKKPAEVNESDIEILRFSVNPVRLKNNPIELSAEAIETLYRKLLGLGE